MNDLINGIEVLNTDSYHYASYFHEIIMEQIREFEANLDNDHEICRQLASFGKNITLAVTGIGYHNPSTLYFYGYVGKQPATLIQNVNQLNFLLISAEKSCPDKPPRRIGFSQPPSEG